MASSEEIEAFFDADVIINWLVKETESDTGFPLWKAPYRIVKLVEEGEIHGYSSLVTSMEIRFVLRRKKDLEEKDIEEMLDDFRNYFTVEVPDSLDIMQADRLQSSLSLDPFDSIYLSLLELISPDVLLSRDAEFLETVNDREELQVEAMEPEEFLEQNFPDTYEEELEDYNTP